MKKYKAYLIILLGSFMIQASGCSKSQKQTDVCETDCILLQGVVSDTASSIPIKGVKIKVEGVSGWSLYASHWDIAETKTDEEGLFYLNFPKNYKNKEAGHYIMSIERKDFLFNTNDRSNIFEANEVEVDVPKEFDFKMFTLTNMVILVHNQSSHYVADFSYKCDNCLDSREKIDLLRIDSSFSMNQTIKAGFPTEFRYTYWKNTQKREEVKFITAKPDESALLIINITD